MTDSDVRHLCPELLPLYREWLIRCHGAGLAVKAIVTWRSATDQNAAKTNGLSNASAGQSPHNCCDNNGNPASKAFDFACFGPNAEYIKNGADDRYTQAGEIAEEVGLIWGGRWKHRDFDHIELPHWNTEQAEPVTT